MVFLTYPSEHIFKQKWGCPVHLDFCVCVTHFWKINFFSEKLISWINLVSLLQKNLHQFLITCQTKRCSLASWSSLCTVRCMQLSVETHVPNHLPRLLCSFYDSWRVAPELCRTGVWSLALVLITVGTGHLWHRVIIRVMR